jgi:hypothetical protein
MQVLDIYLDSGIQQSMTTRRLVIKKHEHLPVSWIHRREEV